MTDCPKMPATKPRQRPRNLLHQDRASAASALLAALLALMSTSACSKPEQDRSPVPSGAAPTVPAASAPALATAPPRASAEPKPPEPAVPYNVILIMIDSMRADMPWTGYPRDIAPWLTRYQKGCMTYTQAYSLSSYTAKSVVPALVGEY
ncbi:MAG TPA: hypothetical protein VFU02_06910, partial [Polyangiaceae bacterium]|nr:hypothetical protein [Polyangiaceae bacterium]